MPCRYFFGINLEITSSELDCLAIAIASSRLVMRFDRPTQYSRIPAATEMAPAIIAIVTKTKTSGQASTQLITVQTPAIRMVMRWLSLEYKRQRIPDRGFS
jgi:hypothetical protein